MDLTVYIKELLFLHDCVIIPEFGGFVANYKPARINHKTHTLIPPSKDISFNKSLTHNDGLLISYVSEKRGIGYVDAKRIVGNFVKEVNRNLEGGKRIPFDEIGTFFHDNQKNLQFDPDLSKNYLLDAYGLDEFTIEPLEDFDLQKRLAKRMRDKEPVRSGIRKKILWRVAIAVPILVALVVVPLKTDLLKFNTSKSSMNPILNTELMDSEPVSPVLENETFTAGESDEEIRTASPDEMIEPQETEMMEEELADIPAEPPVEGAYYIIAGSFQNPEYARRFNTDLTTKGFNSIIMEPINGLHRVTLNSYPTKNAAVTALNELREDPANKELWILKK